MTLSTWKRALFVGVAVAISLPVAASASSVPATTPQRTRLTTPAPSHVAGVVLDARTGAPIAGARVEVADAPGTPVATTGADGRFHLASLPAGVHALRVTASGFRALVEKIEIAAGRGATIEFHLSPAALRHEEQVVVMPSRQERPAADLPQAVAVIDREALDRAMPRSTPEALADAAGVLVQKTNHGSGSPYLRGLVGNQVLVLVDGVRLNNSTYRYGPNQYLATVDPASIERIEVQRGSGSVLHGSDAVGGVVNIVTRRARLSDGPVRVGGSASGRLMTSGMEQSGSVEAEASTSRAGVRAGFSVRHFGDVVAGGSLGVEAPSGYRERAANASALFGLGRSSLLSISFQDLRQEDVPRFDQVKQRGFARYRFDPQVRQLVAADWRLFPGGGPIARVSSTVSLQHTRERRERQAAGSTLLVVEQDAVRTAGATLDLELREAAGWTLRAGMDGYADAIGSWRRDQQEATGTVTARRGLYPDGARASSLAGFLTGSTRRGPFHLDLGARYSRFTVAANDASFGRIDLRPSALVGSAASRVALTGRVEIVASVAQSFRAPNLDDVSTLGVFDYGVEVPSPGLRPERGVAVEAGVRARGSRAAVSGVVYRIALADLIERVEASFNDGLFYEGQRVYRKANVARAYVEGLEIEGEWRLKDSIVAEGQLTYTYGEQVSAGQPMRRIPPLNGTASLRWTHPSRLWVQATLRLAAAQRRLAPGDLADHRIAPGGTPGWSVVGLQAGLPIARTVSVNVAVVNLFDEAYRIHGSGIDEYGRSARIGTQISF